RLPGGNGAAALGAFMAGDHSGAQQLIERSAGSRSRLRGEVAVLLDRFDLVAQDASAMTRARAAWARGDLSGAVEILEAGGKGTSRYARRLRSELQLLSPGHRLPAGPRTAAANRQPAPGERKSTRLNSSHVSISYAVFGLKKTKARARVGRAAAQREAEAQAGKQEDRLSRSVRTWRGSLH